MCKQILLCACILLGSIHSHAQDVINGNSIKINNKNLIYFNSDTQFEPMGMYRFGDSEWESYLCIFKFKNKYIAQYRYFKVIDNNSNPFLPIFINLENVKIEDGFFYSKNWQGRFVYCNNCEDNMATNKKLKPEKTAGIVFSKTPFPELIFKNEFGTKEKDFYILNGDYPEASYRLLKYEDILSYGMSRLKIVRNEIFARYYYDFKVGGEMEHYFEKTNWYKAQYSNVNSFLTEIEKYNIKLILNYE